MLITVEELFNQLQQPDRQTVVFDCRFSLADKALGKRQYDWSHIPGSHFLDLEQDLSGPVGHHGGRHPLPDPTELSVKLGIYGVDNEARVVVYDAGEGMAARAWWLLRYLGHAQVQMLDGGWQAWNHAGYDTTGKPSAVNPKIFPLRLQPQMLVSLEDILGQSSGFKLLDARAAERFRGETEPLDAKAGHIPGAINSPWTDGLNTTGHWKDSAAQCARWPNLKADEAIVSYCGSGVTACNNVFAMELAGIRNVRLYAGSWSDWCSYPERQVASGADE